MSEILPNFTDTTRVSLSSADNIKIGEFFTGLNIGLFIDLIHARARRTFDTLFKSKGYLWKVRPLSNPNGPWPGSADEINQIIESSIN